MPPVVEKYYRQTIAKPRTVFHLFHGEPRAETEQIGIVYWYRTNSDPATLAQEHSEYRWLPPQEALHLPEPQVARADIEALVAELAQVAGTAQAGDKEPTA